MDNVAVNIIFWFLCGHGFHFFGINARSTVAWLCVKYMFSFLEAAKCFPELLYHFTFPPVVNGRFSHSTSLLAFPVFLCSVFLPFQ